MSLVNDPATPIRDDLVGHVAFVHALARATLRGDPDCEDLEQDVWASAIRGAPADPERQRSWLVTVLRRRAADIRRRRARRWRREAAVARVSDATLSTLDAVERAENGRRLVAALLSLEEPVRSTVLLRFQDGMPPRAIAAAEGVPVETVRTRVRRGLEQLRRSLVELSDRDARRARGFVAALVGGSTTGTTSPAWIGIGGAIVTKKLAVVVGLILLLGGAAISLRDAPTDREPPGQSARPDAAAPSDASALAAAPPVRPSTASSPTAVRAGASPTAREPRVVRGTIVGEDGTPIAGARVRGSAQFVAIQDRVLGAVATPPFPTVETDARGRFELPLEDPSTNGAHVGVRATGWYLPTPPYQSGVFLTLEVDHSITLHRGVPLDVRVVDDATASGIEGAVVTVRTGRGGVVAYTMESGVETATDALGIASFSVGGGEQWLSAQATGYAESAAVTLDVGPEGARPTIRLTRGLTVELTVVDPEGRPVPGARTALLRAPDGVRRGTADSSGVTAFPNVRSVAPDIDDHPSLRIALVAATADGFARSWQVVPLSGAGSLVRARLALVRPRSIAGRVRHEDGSPAAGVMVSASTAEGGPEWGWSSEVIAKAARSDASGEFTLADVVPGVVRVSSGGRRESSVTVAVPATGDVAPIDLVVVRDVEPLRVRVVDADDRPVAGAGVQVVVPSSEFATEAPRTTSSDGAVSLPVRGAPPWWIFVDVPRSGPHLLRFDARPTGPIEIRPGSRRIAGRVERLDGSAARVRLALRTVLQTEQVGYVLDARLGAVETDAQGRFVFEGVQAEPSGFHCLTGGFDIVPFESFTSKPRPLPDEGIRVVVVDASETPRLRLEVDVLDARSHGPLAEKPEVHVSQDYGAGYSFAWSVTGSRSLHRTDGLLAAGTWHVRVQADGYVTTELTTTVPRADDSPIRVLLERAR